MVIVMFLESLMTFFAKNSDRLR